MNRELLPDALKNHECTNSNEIGQVGFSWENVHAWNNWKPNRDL